MIKRGADRVVLPIGPVAFKFARRPHGARCNLFEADLYRRTTPERRAMLCPVIACSANGAVLIMKRLTPLTLADHSFILANLPDWDYGGPGDDECPFESKPENWAMLDERLVALDYSNSVRES